MEDKIAKLQTATEEAAEQVKVCQQALELAETQLAQAKDKYRNLPPAEQESLQINDTELPELIEIQLRAKNVYETVLARYQTNQRYLTALRAKKSSG